MVDHARLHLALRDFVQTMAGAYGTDGLLSEILDAAVGVLGCRGSGVVLHGDQGLESVAASDDSVARVQDHEVAAGQGPCHDALRTGQTITSPRLAGETRWPGFTDGLPGGTSALAAVPLLGYGRAVGALLVCWEKPHRATREELEVAWLLAEMAAAHVVNVEVATDAERLGERLRAVADAEAGRTGSR